MIQDDYLGYIYIKIKYLKLGKYQISEIILVTHSIKYRENSMKLLFSTHVSIS